MLRIFLLLCASFVVAGAAVAQTAPSRTFAYPQDAIDAFATLPVQDGGRIKPLSSFARFALLRLNERSSVMVPDQPGYGAIAGARLGPTEWVMDLLLHPAQADGYPTFLVTDRELLDLVGLSDTAKGRRDRYAFSELAPALEQIALRARAHVHTSEEDRTRIQDQLVDLHHDLLTYRGLRSAFDAARARLPVTADAPTLRAALGEGRGEARLSDAVRAAGSLLAAYRALVTSAPTTADERQRHDADLRALDAFLAEPLEWSRAGGALAWLPPADPDDEVWIDLRSSFAAIGRHDLGQHTAQIEAIALLEAVVDAHDDPARLAKLSRAWVDRVRRIAEARGEGLKVGMETAFYRRDHFGRAQWSFVLGLALVLLAFLAPRSRLLYCLGWAPAMFGAVMLAWGVTERCILRARPPVSTLYETLLFVTATIVALALIFEAIVAALRIAAARRIALLLATVLGATGTFLAARHETFHGEDTMPQLQAVLDTNFWLSTHVTTITLGYTAGLLAGFLGHLYVIGRLVGWRRGRSDERSTYRWIGRMTYASLCFAVLLATVGTILGGVWANDSWGRFWGWDPKENGALMIVLWNLLILHGRFAGLWRDHGIAILAILGNVIVAFSWWGVNLMGVGLHSYGFQSGLKFWVTAFYLSQIAVAALGAAAHHRSVTK